MLVLDAFYLYTQLLCRIFQPLIILDININIFSIFNSIHESRVIYNRVMTKQLHFINACNIFQYHT